MSITRAEDSTPVRVLWWSWQPLRRPGLKPGQTGRKHRRCSSSPSIGTVLLPWTGRRKNGGLGKRSYGSTAGLIVVFGNPVLSDAISPVRVAEGVADAMALASRYAGPAVATLGTSGMADEEGGTLVRWLVESAAGAVIHADADAGGEHNARQLRRQLTAAAGGRVAAVLPAQGKDAAAAAAGIPFPALPTGWEDYAKTLAETTNWPRWEIARQAVCILSEVADDA